MIVVIALPAASIIFVALSAHSLLLLPCRHHDLVLLPCYITNLLEECLALDEPKFHYFSNYIYYYVIVIFT
jgi:hypothetical protein